MKTYCVPVLKPRHKSPQASWVTLHICLWKMGCRGTFLWFSRSWAADTHSINFKGMRINQQAPSVSSVRSANPEGRLWTHRVWAISSWGQPHLHSETRQFSERKRDAAFSPNPPTTCSRVYNLHIYYTVKSVIKLHAHAYILLSWISLPCEFLRKHSS